MTDEMPGPADGADDTPAGAAAKAGPAGAGLSGGGPGASGAAPDSPGNSPAPGGSAPGGSAPGGSAGNGSVGDGSGGSPSGGPDGDRSASDRSASDRSASDRSAGDPSASDRPRDDHSPGGGSGVRGDSAAAGPGGEDGAAGGRKLLTRSRRSKIIGGVCGGLGRFFGIDPVIFRVVLVVLSLTGGVGLISYGIGWLLIPMEGEDETEIRRLLSGRIEGTAMTAVFGTLVGSGLFLSTMDNGNTQAFALCLIGAVVAAVYWSQRRRAWLSALRADYSRAAGGATASGAGTVREAPPAPQPPPDGAPSWWRGPASVQVQGPHGPVSFVKTGPGVYTARPEGGGRRYVWGPEEPGERDGDGESPAPGRERRHREPREDHEGGLYGAAVFLLSLLVGAAALVALWHRRPLGTALEAGFAGMLVVLGAGMVVGAFAGRRGHGLIGWALVASFLAAVSSTMPKSVGTDWQRATWRPASAASVRPEYNLGAGQGVLDLTAAGPKRGATVTTSVNMGAGQIVVRVPANVTVELVAQVGLGDIRLPNETRHDVNVSADRTNNGSYAPRKGVKPVGTVVLDLKLGAGQVEVLRGPAS